VRSASLPGGRPGPERVVTAAGAAPEARRHFDIARLEFLKGLRALLDARIEQCAKPRAKGEKINVE
jgi:hypothetical protein